MKFNVKVISFLILLILFLLPPTKTAGQEKIAEIGEDNEIKKFDGVKILVDKVKSRNVSLHKIFNWLRDNEAEISWLDEDEEISLDNLQAYDIFILFEPFYDKDSAFEVESYVKKGGSLLFIGDNQPDAYSNYLEFSGITYKEEHPSSGHTNSIWKFPPITNNISKIRAGEPRASLNVEEPAKKIIMKIEKGKHYVITAISKIEKGRVAVIADDHIFIDDCISHVSNFNLAKNIFLWLRTIGKIEVNFPEKLGWQESQKIEIKCQVFRSIEITVKTSGEYLDRNVTTIKAVAGNHTFNITIYFIQTSANPYNLGNSSLHMEILIEERVVFEKVHDLLIGHSISSFILGYVFPAFMLFLCAIYFLDKILKKKQRSN